MFANVSGVCHTGVYTLSISFTYGDKLCNEEGQERQKFWY